MRTYSQADWTAALHAWEDGDFSDEWRGVRHQAAMRGMIYPPEGTKWDSWEDDSPSQRAMLIRAIRSTPELLSKAIAQSRSWTEVLTIVLRQRDDWRLEMEQRERLIEFARPTHRQAVMSIAQILDRIEQSRGGGATDAD